jgi:1-aminocyclopropane-1-carboxylate deaminase/D-cysteine desulfhydrase-like pyridoxal-dependent ACC family enzyme
VRRPARVGLTALPTALQRAPRLERHLGAAPIWVKRDDLTGFVVAGNKARKLELLIADARAQRADALVTGGGPASNHCAAAAAAGRVAGLACHLVLYGSEGAEHPNLALARSCGATISFTGDDDRGSVDERLQAVAARLRDRGLRPYVVGRGGASPLGVAAYALAARELGRQLARAEVRDALVVVAAGSCGTLAGLAAGNSIGRLGWRLVGASVSRPVEECEARTAELAGAACRALGERAPLTTPEIVDARGPGYGRPSEEGGAAAELALATEGLLLDPTFTAKAFAAGIDLARRDAGRPLVLVHTGGLVSALWARIEARGRDALV